MTMMTLTERGSDTMIEFAVESLETPALTKAQLADLLFEAGDKEGAQQLLDSAPEAKRQAPALVRPEDLLAHNCLTHAATNSPTVWTFTDGSGPDRAIEVSFPRHPLRGEEVC